MATPSSACAMTGEFLNLDTAASVLAPFGGDQCDCAGRKFPSEDIVYALGVARHPIGGLAVEKHKKLPRGAAKPRWRFHDRCREIRFDAAE